MRELYRLDDEMGNVGIDKLLPGAASFAGLTKMWGGGNLCANSQLTEERMKCIMVVACLVFLLTLVTPTLSRADVAPVLAEG